MFMYFFFGWGHAILHPTSLIRLRSITYHKYSPLQLLLGQQPNIRHLRVFGCDVYIPIHLKFMLALILHLSLDTLNPKQLMSLRHDLRKENQVV